jgi:glucan-binding YG repeat protein
MSKTQFPTINITRRPVMAKKSDDLMSSLFESGMKQLSKKVEKELKNKVTQAIKDAAKGDKKDEKKDSKSDSKKKDSKTSAAKKKDSKTSSAKTGAKTSAKASAKTGSTAKTAAKTAAKAAAAKAAAKAATKKDEIGTLSKALKPKLVIEQGTKKYTPEELIKLAQQDAVLQVEGTIKKLEIRISPAKDSVYYLVNDGRKKYELF